MNNTGEVMMSLCKRQSAFPIFLVKFQTHSSLWLTYRTVAICYMTLKLPHHDCLMVTKNFLFCAENHNVLVIDSFVKAHACNRLSLTWFKEVQGRI